MKLFAYFLFKIVPKIVMVLAKQNTEQANATKIVVIFDPRFIFIFFNFLSNFWSKNLKISFKKHLRSDKKA